MFPRWSQALGGLVVSVKAFQNDPGSRPVNATANPLITVKSYVDRDNDG